MQTLLVAVGVYAVIGAVFAAVYVTRLAPRRDPALRASGKSVRLLLIPGAVAVWPLLLRERREGGR